MGNYLCSLKHVQHFVSSMLSFNRSMIISMSQVMTFWGQTNVPNLSKIKLRKMMDDLFLQKKLFSAPYLLLLAMIDTSLTFHLFSNCCSIWHFQLNVHWFFVRINFPTGDIFHQIQQEACCSNFEVFFTLFLAQFSQQKKKFTKAVSEPFARLIIRYSRRLWKVFRKGVSSLLDWSPIQGWWWKGWSYPFGIIWTHFHLLWYGVSEVYLISKFPKEIS